MTFSVFKHGEHTLYHGDCLTIFPSIPDASVDLICCDLPYGTIPAKWDCVIPPDALWEAYGRVIKPKGAIVLFASQPFTSALVSSKPEWFRCEWIWDKKNGANFANAKRQPLKVHESILVFGKEPPVYYPVMTEGAANHTQGKSTARSNNGTNRVAGRAADDLSGLKYPKSIIEFPKHSSQSKLHPTQKPVDLMAYLIETYSEPGDVVLDNCAGSGSTGAACLMTGRTFIGMEMNDAYFKIMSERLFPFSDLSDSD